jgi:signal transduction histidine kinase
MKSYQRSGMRRLSDECIGARKNSRRSQVSRKTEGATLLKRTLSWLANVPVEDPVDRSNAFFMQLFFAFYGCITPLNKLNLLMHANLPMLMYSRTHVSVLRGTSIPLFVDLATDVILTASAWIGIYLIRRGMFRLAVKQFLILIIASGVLFFATNGFVEELDSSMFFCAMIIGALMLGRQALWYVFGGTLLAYFTGMTMEMLFPTSAPRLLSSYYTAVLGVAYVFLMIAIVLDRSVKSLRNSYEQVKRQHKQLQHEIAERDLAREQVLHAQKMDAVGNLASGIAHDIHNVLAVILGFARRRQRLYEPNDNIAPIAQELADALEGTELAARRGAAVCRQLLNFSRRSVTMTETFDVAETLREMRPLLHQLLPPTTHLNVKLPDLSFLIDFDRNQFELALLSLVTNARDAMPDGGQCVIEATRFGKNHVEITIRDNGTGMSEETVQRVFEPFFTTKPVGVGTGLGLSVVYDLVNRAGGSIAIDSVLGSGTCVRIRLPMVQAVAQDARQPSAQSVRVWLIDDDDDLRMLLKAALEQGGCIVDEAANGTQAMRQLATSRSAPQVLICDHRMPDMDGSTLLAHIRERYPTVPAILISSYMEGDNPAGKFAHTLNERLPKPFAPEILLTHVQDMARRNAPSEKTNDFQ